MIQFFRLLIGLALVINGSWVRAQDVWLVSEQEKIQYEGEAGYAVQPSLRARAVLPLIEILQPELDHEGKLQSPFTLEVVFRARAEMAIDPSTFKIFYGASQFDVTARLQQWTDIKEEGFKLLKVKLPKGRHLITLQVSDVQGKFAGRELRLEVE